jgi:hypothetical protein
MAASRTPALEVMNIPFPATPLWQCGAPRIKPLRFRPNARDAMVHKGGAGSPLKRPILRFRAAAYFLAAPCPVDVAARQTRSSIACLGASEPGSRRSSRRHKFKMPLMCIGPDQASAGNSTPLRSDVRPFVTPCLSSESSAPTNVPLRASHCTRWRPLQEYQSNPQCVTRPPKILPAGRQWRWRRAPRRQFGEKPDELLTRS